MRYPLIFLLGVLVGVLFMLAIIWHASIAPLPDVIIIAPVIGMTI